MERIWAASVRSATKRRSGAEGQHRHRRQAEELAAQVSIPNALSSAVLAIASGVLGANGISPMPGQPSE